MNCEVCQGRGHLGALPCGRCAGRGRRLNFALFDVLTFAVLVAGIVGAIGYVARINQDAPTLEEARPRTGTLYHRVPR